MVMVACIGYCIFWLYIVPITCFHKNSNYRVLLKDTAGIPEERLRMLRDSVAGHYQVEGDQLTMETIQAAANIDPRFKN